jgi:hypothetical protein
MADGKPHTTSRSISCRERGAMSTTVETTVTMRLLGHPSDVGTPVSATFRYDVARPFAVETAFHLADVDVVWTYARDLLITGMTEHTGQGDVRVWPVLPQAGSGVAAMVRIELTSPTGHALLEAKRDDVHRFLEQSLSLCPRGDESEHIDVDQWLAGLLRT